ncbi:MAG TPA: hypothetical protein PK006_06270 [Saprospiraceae bacterium]|nr:hypothetical protein [Saprospiraceae bacterium]
MQYWFLNADKNLQPWCDWASLTLQSFDYTPVSIDFDLTSSGGGSTEMNPIQASIENCIDIKESLCINSNISSITHEIMVSNNTILSIVGLDSVYCNKDTVISLIGKGIPSGGKFYLNGIEITSFNPAVLSLNTVYDLKYFNGSPGICSDTAIHQFIIYSKPDFTVNAMSGCIGDKIKVSLTGNNTLGNFQWTWDGGRVVSGTGSGPYEIIYSSPGVKTIRVSSNTNFCGNFEASKTITISGITVSISKDTSIINGSFVDLSVNPLGGTRYKFVWSPSNSLSCGDCPNPRATPKRSTKYCVTVTDEINGCTATSCVNVRVSCCK